MKWFFASLFTTLLFIVSTKAQQKYTISGFVKDSSSRETLIGAGVSVKSLKQGVNALKLIKN
jgi:hypothetical protein